MSSKQGIASFEMEGCRDLGGKIVMVTGASSGIGREFCIDLAKAGCRIIAAARRMDYLKTLCNELNNMDVSYGQANIGEVRAVAIELDVNASGPTIKARVQEAWDAFSRIDVLINNAGVRGPVKSPLDLLEEEWDGTYGTNVRGCWLMSKYVCRRMVASNQQGSVINISSVVGLQRTYPPGGVAYASSKSALNTMTKVMAMELGKHKIRVNSISPGIFKSEITEGLFRKEWVKNVVSKIVPLKDLGTTNPGLTSLVRYLIHGSSSYVTGNIFIVDAGSTLASVPLYSSL